MRKIALLIPLLACASPLLAQPAPADSIQLPRELADPATADRLANMAQALSQAVLDMPVGELKAAAEGRRASPAERRLTVRDLARRDDPNFDRDIQRKIAESGPAIRQSIKAVNEALPAITQSLQQASRAIERAAANMPDPTYPRR
jgi:hypothetical protein